MDTSNFFNLTPHDLTIVDAEGNSHILPRFADPEDREDGRYLIIRAATQKVALAPVDGVEVFRTTYGEPEVVSVDAKGQNAEPSDHLARIISWIDPVRNATPVLIVSFIALQATGSHFMGCQVLAPGELIRDEAGKPIGCKGLSAL